MRTHSERFRPVSPPSGAVAGRLTGPDGRRTKAQLPGPACGNVTRTFLTPKSTLSAAVPPIRRTTLLAVVSLGLVVAAVVAGYVGFMATIGGTWSHEQAIDACAATPSTSSIPSRAAGFSVRESWRWWLPGHSHACVYEMKDGTKVVRPVPAGY